MEEQEIMKMYNITKLQKQLVDLMIEANLSRKTALIILKWMGTEEMEKEMVEYIQKHKEYITDHQVLQHLARMVQ